MGTASEPFLCVCVCVCGGGGRGGAGGEGIEILYFTLVKNLHG